MASVLHKAVILPDDERHARFCGSRYLPTSLPKQVKNKICLGISLLASSGLDGKNMKDTQPDSSERRWTQAKA